MAVTLTISIPVRPWTKNKPMRFVYRITFASGRVISLKRFADQLDIPHTTLLQNIRFANLGVGSHQDKFMAVLAILRKRRELSNRCRTQPCPQCGGRGRIPRVSAPSVGSAINNTGTDP